MKRLHIIWDVEKARPASCSLPLREAIKKSCDREDVYGRPFIVLPAKDVAISL